MNKPNILIIHCHDLGDYLGCYGTPVETPNLNMLAEEGMLFDNHFSPAAVCSPSRGSLWTGCYPHTHGLMGLVPRGWEIDVDSCPPLTTILQNNGYQTHLFGLQHEHWDPYRLGYDKVHPVKSDYCEVVTEAVVGWLEGAEPKEKPFLASVGFFDPHRIGLASQGFSEELLGSLPSHFKREIYESADPVEIEVRPYLPDIPAQRQELADFYGAVKLVDRMVGFILQALKKSGLARETMVIFTTDHGASFLHSKGTLYDGGVKVALIMRWPGSIPAGCRIDSLTSHVDFVPSILEWLGISVPDHIQGNSLVELFTGRESGGREYVFGERNYTQYFDPSRMVRSRDFKYIRNGLRKSIFDFVITEIELSSASFRNNAEVFDFYSSRRVTEELYDLRSDPAEMHNLAGDERYRKIEEEMKSALDEHLQATRDPFVNFRNELQMPEDVYSSVKRGRKK
jgi:N-sulfoglucosamine sulfohydrolase